MQIFFLMLVLKSYFPVFYSPKNIITEVGGGTAVKYQQ